jgi:hypothetical protein
MADPLQRSAVLRPAHDEDYAVEVSEGNDDSDWALWDDSVQAFEACAIAVDPFGAIGRRDA